MSLTTPGYHDLEWGLSLVGVPSSEVNSIAGELRNSHINDKILKSILETHQNVEFPHPDDVQFANLAYDNIVGGLEVAEVDVDIMFEYVKKYFKDHESQLPIEVETNDSRTGIENILEYYGLAHQQKLLSPMKIETILTESDEEFKSKVGELTEKGWKLESIGNECTRFKNQFPILLNPTMQMRTMTLPPSIEVYKPGYGPKQESTEYFLSFLTKIN